MLELLGKEYITDHCICNLRKISDESIYRVYVTDALKSIAHNTSQMAESGMTMQTRYIDIIDRETQNKKPKETSEQIKKRIMAGVNALAKQD